MSRKGEIKIIKTAVGSMPSWGLIRELQNSGVEVIGVDSNHLSFGLHLLNRRYVVPKGSDSNFIIEMLKIIKKEQPSAILSGIEEELLSLSANREKIEENGILLLCPDHEYVEVCADKWKTSDMFVRIGIPTPIIHDCDSVEFPCVIKPRFGRGSSNVYIVNDTEDLHFYINKINNPLIQEFVQGSEYTIDVLADRNGNVLSVVPRMRLEIESGISVKSKTVYDKEIIDYSRHIVKKMKLFGPSCIQCIRNDNEVKFIEVNNRFGGGSILSIKADSTIIPNLIKMIKGEKLEPSKGFKEGLTMLRYYSEVFITNEEIENQR